MRALFAHDHKFYCDEGVFYSNAFSYELWKRYLEYFANLTVVARVSIERLENEVRKSSGPKVTFSPLSAGNIGSRCGLPSAARGRMDELVQAHDAVIARLPSENGLLAVAAAKKFGKPVLVEVVGSAWDALWNHGALGARLYAPLAQHRMRAAVQAADFLLYVTGSTLQLEYPGRHTTPTVSASNVELPELERWVLEQRLSKLATTTGPARIGLIGSMSSNYKGIHIALRALAGLKKSLVWHFDVVGPGDPHRYEELAQELGIADRVSFVGTLEAGHKILRWIDGIDLYIQPSLQEGLPRALIEAMSRGCPAIASDAGGSPELLPPACIVKSGSVHQLRLRIEAALADPTWFRQQACQNFENSKKFEAPILRKRRKFILSQLAGATK